MIDTFEASWNITLFGMLKKYATDYDVVAGGQGCDLCFG